MFNRTHSFLFAIFSLFMALVSIPAHAVDYYWEVSGYQATLGKFSDPFTACEARVALAGGNVTPRADKYSDTRYRCYFVRPDSTSGFLSDIYRFGDSCAAGYVYDVAQAKCLASDPCLPTLGNSITSQFKVGDISTNGHLTNPVSPPETVCSDSCGYTAPSQVSCFRFISGDPAGAFCNFDYRGDGQSCVAGTATPAPVVPMPTDPVKNDTASCTEKVYDAEGRLHYTCQTTKEYTDPGSMDCGTVNGVTTCIADSPTPNSTKTTESIDVTEKTNTDGSKDTATTTTTNTTVCSGVNSCATTTTTSQTSQHTNSDGTAGTSETTCTGPGCTNADGKTQEELTKEEEAKPSVSGAESCDAVMSCNGDVMQCEILTQLKDERCRLIESQDYESNKQTIADAVAGPDYQLEEQMTQIPSFVASGTRFLPSGSCPPPATVTVAGQLLSFEYEPFCSFASGIAPVVVGVSLLLAALYVGRGLGG